MSAFSQHYCYHNFAHLLLQSGHWRVGSFQEFTNAFIMTKGGPQDATLFLILYIYQNAFQFFKMGYAATIAWVLFVIIMVIAVLQFRFARS